MIAWLPVFTDAFVTPDRVAWNFTGPGWGYAPQPDGSGRLTVFNSSAPVFYQGHIAADVAVESTVEVSSGTAHVYARHSGTFGYEVRLSPTGEVVLLRAGVVMNAVLLPEFNPTVPHVLRLNVAGSRLWVEVNRIVILVVDDPAPLPPGQVGLSASFAPLPELVTPVPPQSQVTFAVFTVYQPADQVTPTASPTTVALTVVPTMTAWLTPTATPVFPPVQLPPLVEGAAFSAFSFSEPIEVADGDVTGLIAALSMTGTVTINLAPNGEYMLTDAPYDLFAPTGLPIIRAGTDITVNGNGAIIRAASSGFRIFAVDQGTLTLNDLILRDATLFTNGGAAVSNSGGIVTLNRVRMENNRVEGDTGFGRGTGGALYTFFGRTTVIDSAFINNYAVKYGGGQYNWDGVVTVTNTRFEGNQAGLYGGAAATRDERSGSGITGNGNLYLGNSAVQGGGAIYVESGTFTESGARIENNSGGSGGGVLFSGASGDPVGGSAPDVQVTGSDITGNTSPLIVSASGGNSAFDFNRSWWGNPAGPDPADLIGSGISVALPRPQPVAACPVTPDDTDGDCLPNAFELTIPGLSPDNPDSDGNGVRDGDEDYDGDGLSNLDEFFLGTDPTMQDTDQDELNDGDEVLRYGTNPLNPDTDGDGLLDGYEINVTGTNSLVADTDGDGISDGDDDFDRDNLTNVEEQAAGSDPFNADTDGDRLPDDFEVRRSHTSLLLADTDGNGVTDDLEDPDGDALNNYQEFRLGTDPLVFTTLGAPSRLRSETVLMPVRQTADGSAEIVVTTTVRDAQGRFLPGRAVTWTSSNPNFVFSSATGITDEEGIATVRVTSTAVSSGVVEIRALNVVVGRPLAQFIGGDPAVRFTATSSTSVLAGQVVQAVFEVSNDGVLPIANIEVVANLPFGLGVIEAVTSEGDVVLQGQGSNAATWTIPLLTIGERRTFTLRYRASSTLGLNTTIPLTVQTSAIEDTNAANNSASFSARIAQGFTFPSADQQTEKLSVQVTTEPTTAAIGGTVTLVVRVDNLSSEPLFNVSGFAPVLGTQYPNVAFTWNTPTQPGYLAPAGSGDASFAVARIPFTIPENYPVNLNRLIVVQAIDSHPADGSVVVARDPLTDAELGIRGPNLVTSLTANPTTAVDGQLVTFTLTMSNSSAATDTAVNLQVSGNFIDGVQPLVSLPPGASTTFQFTRTVTLADAPQITAQVRLTGQGETQTDVVIERSLSRTVRVVRPVVPNSANLAFAASPTLVFLPGRTTPLPLTVVNNGEQNADAVRLRVSVPFGIEPDPASLGSGVYDAAARVITWELGTLTIGARQTLTPAFLTPADASVGTAFVLDVSLATASNEITLEDNVIAPSGVVALPAPARVTVISSPRNWLVGDDRDQLTLTVTVFDQLGAPLLGVMPTFSGSLPGAMFGTAAPSDAAGITTTTLRATGSGALVITATFDNGVSGTTTLNRRASAVEITGGPASIGIGGTDRYRLFVVNTATLPDGTTSTSDLVDLTFMLPTELAPVRFAFAQPTLPLAFGDFTDTTFTVSVPTQPELAALSLTCDDLVGSYPFTVTATGRTLGVVGQAQGTLNIVAQPPELTNVVPSSGGRVGGDRVLFRWRSNTPGISTVFYRQQGAADYTTLPLSADPLDTRLYSGAVDVTSVPDGTVFEWYGVIDNGCARREVGSAAAPQTFTRVRSTTFLDAGYDFTVADGYDLTTTVGGAPLTIRVRNDDSVPQDILLDVENPYPDLILGFTGSGSVDQRITLQPGQTFSAPLRVFTQATDREVYSLAVLLEDRRGDVDRIPLVVRVQQPRLDLDIQVLSVDERTLVTTARLTNRGDTLTDLALDIVQDTTGIPANFVIQPDIQHTYLLAGQSLEIAFIPLDLTDASPPAPMSVAASSAPSLAAIPGPYRVTASARNTTIPNITLRDGMLTNTCGADGSARTVAATCTTPAGSETRIAGDWYCTNRPNIDVPISLALPNGGLGVPITSVTAGANFSPGGGVYTHSTTVSLNGSLVGSAVVPSVSRIEGELAPQSLILGGSSPTQLLSLRSTHTNGTHYTVASGFTVTVEYDEHIRTGCFTQEEVDTAASSGGPLMCTPDSSLAIPLQALALNLTVDPDAEAPQNENGAFLFAVGEQIPLIAEISAVGQTNLSEIVRIELTVPRGLVPQGMTIQGEEQSFLNSIFASIIEFLTSLGMTFSEDFANGLSVAGDNQQVTFTYNYDRDLVIGQSFPITLDIVGRVEGPFSIRGRAWLPSNQDVADFNAMAASAFSSSQVANISATLPLFILPQVEGLVLTKVAEDQTPVVDDPVIYSVTLENTTEIDLDQSCTLPESLEDEVTEETCLRINDVVPEGLIVTALTIDGQTLSVTLNNPIDVTDEADLPVHRVWIRTPEDDPDTDEVIEGGYIIDWYIARSLSATSGDQPSTELQLSTAVDSDFVGAVLINQVTAAPLAPVEVSILPTGCDVTLTQRTLLGNNPAGVDQPASFAVDAGGVLGITGQLLPAFNAASTLTWYRVVGFGTSNLLQQGWVRAQDITIPESCFTKIPLLQSAGGGVFNTVLTPSQLTDLESVEDAICFGALRVGVDIPNEGYVLSLSQITQLTNTDPNSAIIGGLTPSYQFDLTRPSIVAVEAFHLNRQYIRVSYFDNTGTLISDGDSWVRVRSQISPITNQISIFELNGKDCRDDAGNFTVGNLEAMLIDESELPICTTTQLFNCRVTTSCRSIFGCTGQTPLVLNILNDKRDGANHNSSGACPAWSGLAGYTDGHCGIDIVTAGDAVNGTATARDVYTLAGGIFSTYTGTDDGTYDINTRITAGGVTYIRESNYTHVEPHPVFGNPNDLTDQGILRFQGEYIAGGVRLGAYGDYGLVGNAAFHLHFVDKYLDDNVGTLSPLRGIQQIAADRYNVDAITNVSNPNVRYLPLTFIGTQEFTNGEVFGLDEGQRQLTVDVVSLPEFAGDLTNPDRVNVNPGAIDDINRVTLAQLRRRTEGENFTYRIEIQGINNPGISSNAEGVITGTLTVEPGNYTILITITRDIDGHTETGTRRLPLIVR